LNGLVGNAIIGRKELFFEWFLLLAKAFAHGLLLIPIPTNVRASVGNPKRSFTDDVIPMQPHLLTREIGPSRTRFIRRHFPDLCCEKKGVGGRRYLFCWKRSGKIK
jgi:hypothetical protein